MAAAGALAAAAIGLVALVLGLGGVAGSAWTVVVDWLVPLGGLELTLDPLAGLFLVLVGGVALPASFYAAGSAERSARGALAYPVFVASMCVVPLAANTMTFVIAWELMSLASYFLVLHEPEERASVRAAWVYAVMTHAGLACLLAGMLLMGAWTGSLRFADWRAAAPGLGAAARGVAFVLLAVGFAGKAGVIPLHVWLPLAHPAAPSHVSALMSGVMTKVAVYGFIRIVFDLSGVPAWWWSIVIIPLAGITCVLGVLSALMQHDLKRLLAYHTVENIGIIFIGLGLALAFSAHNMRTAAAVAMTAALLHVLNHSIFKSLLFFGSGAVLTATGERDMEKLGGLIHGMPLTAFTFLAGCMAISALPPLNGFVSEWLIFQAILLSPELPQWGLKLLVPAVGGMLALSAALAAACFVKAFGVSFLGRPRTTVAAGAQEVDRWSLAAMFIFAGLCLLIGIIPGPIIDTLAPVVNTLVAAHMPMQSAEPWLSIVPIADSRSSYNGLLVFVFITISTLAAIEVIHRRRLRPADPPRLQRAV